MSTKQLSWIGSTSYAQPQGKGDYPGAVCMKFNSIKAYNQYFKEHDSLLVIDVSYQPGWWWGTTVIAMVTNQLNDDELNDMQEVSREIEFAMAARRKTREAAKEEQAKLLEVTTKENYRLADVGRKYEARVKHMRTLPAGSSERKMVEAKLNAGDPEVLGAIATSDETPKEST